MILQEAIRSNKPFKRPEYDYWLVVFQNVFYIHKDINTKVFQMTIKLEIPKKKKKFLWKKEDFNLEEQKPMPMQYPRSVYLLATSILADDWEVKND